MGQRHQFYFRTTKGWASFHHQWCYGSLPLWNLRNVLEFNKKASDGYSFHSDMRYIEDYKEIFKHLLSTDARRGYHNHVIDLEEEMGQKPDPSTGDNNDGITVCDFTAAGDVGYAFVNIDHLEGKGGDGDATLLTPLSAEAYASWYYKKNGREWKAYGISKNIKFIDSHAKLLSLEELARLFPAMYQELMEERSKLRIKKNIPVLMNNLKYEANKEYVNKLLKKGA